VEGLRLVRCAIVVLIQILTRDVGQTKSMLYSVRQQKNKLRELILLAGMGMLDTGIRRRIRKMG
jgi:hypothetical protein